MPAQTYAPVLTTRLNRSQNLTSTDPDHVTGVPQSAADAKAKDITTEVGGTDTTIVSVFLTHRDDNYSNVRDDPARALASFAQRIDP